MGKSAPNPAVREATIEPPETTRCEPLHGAALPMQAGDAVQVPEPTSIALLLVDLGGLGVAEYRRRR